MHFWQHKLFSKLTCSIGTKQYFVLIYCNTLFFKFLLYISLIDVDEMNNQLVRILFRYFNTSIYVEEFSVLTELLSIATFGSS